MSRALLATGNAIDLSEPGLGAALPAPGGLRTLPLGAGRIAIFHRPIQRRLLRVGPGAVLRAALGQEPAQRPFMSLAERPAVGSEQVGPSARSCAPTAWQSPPWSREH